MIRPHRFIGVPDREAILQREPRPGGFQDRDLQVADLVAHGRGNGHDRATPFGDRVGYVLQRPAHAVGLASGQQASDRAQPQARKPTSPAQALGSARSLEIALGPRLGPRFSRPELS